MLLDQKKIEKMMKEGQFLHFIAPRVYPPKDPLITHIETFEHIYGPYSIRLHHQLYVPTKPEEETANFNDDPFTDLVRLKLIHEMLRAPEARGGCGFNIDKLKHHGILKAYFPLHNFSKSEAIWKDWKIGSSGPAKFTEIRDYFGEKVALYFLFLSHMGEWLVVPGLIGVAMNIVVWYTEWYSHPVLPFFAAIISLWSILMLEFFNRRAHSYSVRWGTTNVEDQEQDRPGYEGDMRENFITGEVVPLLPTDEPLKTYKYALPRDQRRRGCLANTVVSIMIFMVIGVVAGIYVFRFWLENHNFGTYSSVIASILNAVQIQVFNLIYTWVSIKMVDAENHRTDTAYENSIISKLFVFQFVNSYSSFFFIAFIAQNMPRPTFLSTDPSNIESTYVGECGVSYVHTYSSKCNSFLKLSLYSG